MKKIKLPGCGILSLFISVVLLVGYIMCVVKFAQCDFDLPLKGEFFYGIGIITGLGAIFGWINFGK